MRAGYSAEGAEGDPSIDHTLPRGRLCVPAMVVRVCQQPNNHQTRFVIFLAILAFLTEISEAQICFPHPLLHHLEMRERTYYKTLYPHPTLLN